MLTNANRSFEVRYRKCYSRSYNTIHVKWFIIIFFYVIICQNYISFVADAVKIHLILDGYSGNYLYLYYVYTY